MEDELLMTHDVARILGVSRGRVWQLAASGRLGRKIEGPLPYYVFTRDEVEAYKQSPTRKAGRPKRGRPAAAALGAPAVPPPAPAAPPAGRGAHADPAPGTSGAPPTPRALVRAGVLASNEPDHLTADGEETLCGRRVHGGAYWRPHLDLRRACRECRCSAQARDLVRA